MSYFFISKQPCKKNLVKYTALNVNNVANPYIEVICSKDEKDKQLSFGSLFDIDVYGKWSEKYTYDKHGYEMVVVLGKPDNNELFVYGNAIGHKKIPIYKTWTDIASGDKLLIKGSSATNFNFETIYDIVHNITKAKMVYEMKSLMK